uniref:Alpha-carbonic anhydrase domain-containing protein n=1 Tax=Craspedostauros australis TaxID=1486917 RepID=A0A7S0F4Q6_9STRA
MDYCVLDKDSNTGSGRNRRLYEEHERQRSTINEAYMMAQLPEHGPRQLSKDEAREYYRQEDRPLGPDDVVVETSHGDYIVRSENDIPKDFDDEAYFEEIFHKFQRNLAFNGEGIDENYSLVQWWPYEWMIKVGTEYYFRYEGTQTVPPCYEKVHWRVMKDPIRVAPHQMRELERLMAWRINEHCQSDTAGAPREDRPEAVWLARPLQYYQELHRKEFCECQDWPSKFPAERTWCYKYRTRDENIRLYENPYNFLSEGF